MLDELLDELLLDELDELDELLDELEVVLPDVCPLQPARATTATSAAPAAPADFMGSPPLEAPLLAVAQVPAPRQVLVRR